MERRNLGGKSDTFQIMKWTNNKKKPWHTKIMYNQPFSHIPMGKQVTGLRHSNSTFSYFSHLSVTVNMDFIDDINRHSPSTQVNSLIKKQLCIINLFNSLFFFFTFWWWIGVLRGKVMKKRDMLSFWSWLWISNVFNYRKQLNATMWNTPMFSVTSKMYLKQRERKKGRG